MADTANHNYFTNYKSFHIKNIEEYKQIYKYSIENPELFWAQQAEKFLTWDKKWDFVLQYDFDYGDIKWFGKGILNASYNCIDRHIKNFRDKIAYYWEGDDPKETKAVTYLDIYKQVNKFAGVLKSRGVKKGDTIIIYMPRIIELPIAMLACARIGAVHSVVCSGFSAKALANRIKDCKTKVVITADAGFRAGKIIKLKANVDSALKTCPDVETIIVFKRADIDIKLNSQNELWWHEAVNDPNLPDFIPPEPMEACDPLFIIYISGSTGNPKGIVHTHGGYLLYVAMTTQMAFDIQDNDVIWCSADMGWIAGHSYGVYGPMANCMSCVLFEGTPLYPDYGRYWEIIAKYKINILYTAPTIIRALAKAGSSHVKKHDLSSLRLLGVGGEAIYPEEWNWLFNNVGRGRCPIVDTYYQAETGGHILLPFPGISPDRSGYCSLPFFGIDAVVLDDTGEEARFPDQKGVLCIKKPWPGMAKSIYANHERFADRYFGQIPGMFFTSDGAMQDEEGFYRITGRIDEVINVSGHRLSTAGIESILVLHPKVSEAAVVGYPHHIKGQGIYAFITLKNKKTGSDKLGNELIQLVRTEIGPIVTIDIIQWADGLPKTRSGKIIRHILEKIAADKTDDLGDIATITDPAIIDNLIQEHISLQGK